MLKKCKKPDDVLFINAAVGDAEIDLDDTHQALLDIEKAIAAAKGTHNGFLKELGLKPLP